MGKFLISNNQFDGKGYLHLRGNTNAVIFGLYKYWDTIPDCILTTIRVDWRLKSVQNILTRLMFPLCLSLLNHVCLLLRLHSSWHFVLKQNHTMTSAIIAFKLFLKTKTKVEKEWNIYILLRKIPCYRYI